MSKKSRILYVMKYLYENTDELHPATSKEIMEYLFAQGFEIHRTTINKDISLIYEIGIDIVTVRSSPNKYFIGNRTLDPVELKMLVDAVYSSKLITKTKSEILIKKISTLGSIHTGKELTHEIFVDKIHKPTNEKIYSTIGVIEEAIRKKSWIDFNYLEYTRYKILTHKHSGYIYEICPYSTFWKDDHYYVLGFSRKHNKIVVFRIDRMDNTRLYSDNWLAPPSHFDVATYANKIFEMYDGEPSIVELKCSNHLMDVIVDKFGEDVETVPLGSKYFKATIHIHVSPRFYGWVFGFMGEISILSPTNIKNEYKKIAQNIIDS